ncbi:MAG TPA: leucyl aminopeptidase [Thermoanaerobaculia bacterium]|nr:leucyl aminopeptidase [Thermoanaerobaculia bacterium]
MQTIKLPTDVRISSRGIPAGDHWVLGLPAGADPSDERLPAPVSGFLAGAARRHRSKAPGWTAEGSAQIGRRHARVSVLGLEAPDRLEPRAIRKWLDGALSAAIQEGAERVVVRLPSAVECLRSEPDAVRVVASAALSGYRFDRYRKQAEKRERERTLWLIPPGGSEEQYRAARRPGLAIARGLRLARDLGNTPPNVATPAWLAEQARDLASECGGKARVLGPTELARRGMGGILAVGQGSANGPRMVRLDLGVRGPKIALVGKGVTFDSGGLSIKPAASMEEMKYDKCGACTVLGAYLAAADLDLPVRLSCFLPLAENLPAASSYRPSDIVRCANGKTVEIINTDAEGRMILADAIHLAARWKPDHLVELSTLTGACVVALGERAAALFSPDDELADALLVVAGEAGERLWRMPLWPEFKEQMKGEHADLKNSGGRWGGANLAAAFLGEFVGDLASWAHLDIAGPAYTTKPAPGRTVGATGYGVTTLVQWMRSLGTRSSTR